MIGNSCLFALKTNWQFDFLFFLFLFLFTKVKIFFYLNLIMLINVQNKFHTLCHKIVDQNNNEINFTLSVKTNFCAQLFILSVLK